jgi:hypothetical protein
MHRVRRGNSGVLDQLPYFVVCGNTSRLLPATATGRGAGGRARQVRAGYVAGGGDLGGGPETPSSRITAQKVVLNQCITSIMPPYFITIVQVVATKWNPIKY